MAMTDPPEPLEAPELPPPRLGSRELYPRLTFDSYLAHAAISPANSVVERATRAVLESMGERGTGAFPLWMAQRDRLRSRAARLLGLSPDDVSLSPGCTRGIADVALALPWERGDTLLTFDGEFPANVVPWQQAARLRGGHVVLLPRPDPTHPEVGRLVVEAVRRAIADSAADRPVRFLSVSSVQFQTGLALPLAELAELCRRNDVYFFVDAIQGCGVLPYDLSELGVDAFFVGAHKWLLGLEGAGFFTTSARLRQKLRPLTAGWLSYRDGEAFLFRGADKLRYDYPLHESGRVFEGSTSNAIGYAALEAGIAICQTLGPANIAAHVQAIHDLLEPELVNRGFRSLRASDPALRSCSLSVALPDDLEIAALAAGLRERGVMASTPDGLLRFAPHFSNHRDEVHEVVLPALDATVRALRK